MTETTVLPELKIESAECPTCGAHHDAAEPHIPWRLRVRRVMADLETARRGNHLLSERLRTERVEEIEARIRDLVVDCAQLRQTVASQQETIVARESEICRLADERDRFRRKLACLRVTLKAAADIAKEEP